MENIILLMCGKNKEKYKTKAKNLYNSERFKLSLEYANTLANEKNIFILSAKHGLVELETELIPYDKSVYDMTIIEKTEWVKMIITKIKSKMNLDIYNFVFLTDDFYCEYFPQYLKNVEMPLQGLIQSDHIKWFKEKLKKE